MHKAVRIQSILDPQVNALCVLTNVGPMLAWESQGEHSFFHSFRLIHTGR